MSYAPENRLTGRRPALRPAHGRRAEPASPWRFLGSFLAEDLLAALAFGQGLVTRAVAAALRWRRINRTIDELSRLDDHVLKDIGVSRAEIVGLAYELEERRRQGRPDWLR